MESIKLRSLKAQIPNPPLETLRLISGKAKLINLSANENPRGPSPMAVEAIKAAARETHRYPDGDGQSLREKLASFHRVKPECIVLGCGISELLLMAAETWLESNDSVLVPDCTFPLYEFVVHVAGHRATRIPLRRYKVDLGSVARLVEPNLKLIYLANPNNPTGQGFTWQELQELMRKLPAAAIILVDEAYRDYADALDIPEPSFWVENDLPVIALRTFSKVYGLAGLRIGYAVASPRLAGPLQKVRLPYNVSQVAILAASAALEDRQFVAECLEANRQGRELLQAGAAAAGHSSLPSHANFILLEAGTSGDMLARRLLEKGILVRSTSAFGFPGCIRVSVGTEEENRTFSEVLSSL